MHTSFFIIKLIIIPSPTVTTRYYHPPPAVVWVTRHSLSFPCGYLITSEWNILFIPKKYLPKAQFKQWLCPQYLFRGFFLHSSKDLVQVLCECLWRPIYTGPVVKLFKKMSQNTNPIISIRSFGKKRAAYTMFECSSNNYCFL